MQCQCGTKPTTAWELGRGEQGCGDQRKLKILRNPKASTYHVSLDKGKDIRRTGVLQLPPPLEPEQWGMARVGADNLEPGVRSRQTGNWLLNGHDNRMCLTRVYRPADCRPCHPELPAFSAQRIPAEMAEAGERRRDGAIPSRPVRKHADPSRIKINPMFVLQGKVCFLHKLRSRAPPS
jgi:hypothetical protein